MAVQSGNTAVFKWHNGTALQTIANVAAINSLTLDGAVIDVSELSTDAFRSFISGKYQATFSIELFYNETAHAQLTADFLARDARACQIDFGDGTFDADAILTNCTLSAGLDDVSRISISAQITGAITIT